MLLALLIMASISPSYPGVLFVVIGLYVGRRIPEDLSDSIYGLPLSVVRTHPFLVIDTIHQSLGNRVIQQLHTRAGILAHYSQIAQIDHDHLERCIRSFGRTNTSIHLIDPLDQLAHTGRLHPSPERSCEAFLSNALDGVTALSIIQDVGLMTDVFGKERAIGVLEKFLKLGREPTGHLFEDPDLQQSFRLAFSPSIMTEQSVTAPSITTSSSISGRSAASTDTVPRQLYHSSDVLQDQNGRGRPRKYRRGSHRQHDSASSTQSTSTASTSEKKGVKCELTGCERHVPFLTPRGLREHYRLKHDVPTKQAYDEAKAAFETAADFTPRPRFLEVPGTPYNNRHNRNSRPGDTDFEGIGYQFSAGAYADPVAARMPLTPVGDNMTLQSFPPYGSMSGLIFSPHDQSVGSSFDADGLGFGLVDPPTLSWNENHVFNPTVEGYPILFGDMHGDNAVNFTGFYGAFDRQDTPDRRSSPTYDSSS